jgi:hypothetical protein
MTTTENDKTFLEKSSQYLAQDMLSADDAKSLVQDWLIERQHEYHQSLKVISEAIADAAKVGKEQLDSADVVGYCSTMGSDEKILIRYLIELGYTILPRCHNHTPPQKDGFTILW